MTQVHKNGIELWGGLEGKINRLQAGSLTSTAGQDTAPGSTLTCRLLQT